MRHGGELVVEVRAAAIWSRRRRWQHVTIANESQHAFSVQLDAHADSSIDVWARDNTPSWRRATGGAAHAPASQPPRRVLHGVVAPVAAGRLRGAGEHAGAASAGGASRDDARHEESPEINRGMTRRGAGRGVAVGRGSGRGDRGGLMKARSRRARDGRRRISESSCRIIFHQCVSSDPNRQVTTARNFRLSTCVFCRSSRSDAIPRGAGGGRAFRGCTHLGRSPMTRRGAPSFAWPRVPRCRLGARAPETPTRR